MADDEELDPSETGENTMLREAIAALRQGDRVRARDLLTRLLKTDQKNADYWVWLSAVVDTQKERLYCLQTALQADPKNAAAKRGLIILGGLPPDDSVPPFPLNRPRLWDEKQVLPGAAQEKLTGWANPLTRVFIILGVAVVVLGLFVGGYMLWPKKARFSIASLPTRTPVRTVFTDTPTTTAIPGAPTTPTPTYLGATPLWMFLEKTYTPTPIYVATKHPVTSRSAFEAGMRFLAQKDYKNALALFQQAEGLEPAAPDIDYYIGNVYRAQGNFRMAIDTYQKAIKKNANFAPAYLGRALANMSLTPGADVIKDLNTAVSLDPNFAEAYLVRGQYQLARKPAVAEADFQAAIVISPDSALAYLYLANAQLAQGKNDAALQSALRANQIDMTFVPVYLALAQAYIATGQGDKAVSALQTYTIYVPDDAGAFLTLGTAYNAAGQYQLALNILNKAIATDRRNAEAYYQRGAAYLGLQNADMAAADFRSAITYNPTDFYAQLGLGRAFDLQKKPGDAYMQLETKAKPLAKTDSTKAQLYYWEALYLEKINDPLSLQGAKNAWYELIALPASAMPADWRTQAFQHLKITPTFTPSLSPTITFTPTMSPTKTFTRTATPKK